MPRLRTRPPGRVCVTAARKVLATTPVFPDHSRDTLRPGSHAASISSRPETPSDFKPEIASSLQARDAFSSVLPLAQKLGSAITTHCLCGINHLGFLLYPTVVHCGQEGFRRGPDPSLALFRISRAAAQSARFRDPGVPSRPSAYFGFVPSFWRPGARAVPCRPSPTAVSN